MRDRQQLGQRESAGRITTLVLFRAIKCASKWPKEPVGLLLNNEENCAVPLVLPVTDVVVNHVWTGRLHKAGFDQRNRQSAATA